MKKNHFELASRLVAEIEVFGDLPIAEFGIRTNWLSGMQNHGIPFVPTYWSGRRDPRKKMRLVRATQQLVELGRLERLTRSRRDRTSHVIPKAEFLVDTVKELSNQVHLPAFFDGLRKTVWGYDMIAEIHRRLESTNVQQSESIENTR
ncbi:MAG: hypothetical protein HKN47_15970 [Pirellulaceae bacterium]|nr:hypothetical protein [Pirellulaceae bacterium]